MIIPNVKKARLVNFVRNRVDEQHRNCPPRASVAYNPPAGFIGTTGELDYLVRVAVNQHLIRWRGEAECLHLVFQSPVGIDQGYESTLMIGLQILVNAKRGKIQLTIEAPGQSFDLCVRVA